MRNLIIPILFVLSFISNAFSQDTLLLYNGDKRIVKVQAISSEIIYYFNVDDTLNLHQFPKNGVSMIIFADGMREEYFREKNIKINQDTITSQYDLGRLYAKKYYRQGPPFVISLLANTVVAFGMTAITENDIALTIGPAISISMLFMKPQSRVAIPDMSLYKNPEFARGARKQMNHDKNASVLLGFVTGLTIDFVFVYLVTQ